MIGQRFQDLSVGVVTVGGLTALASSVFRSEATAALKEILHAVSGTAEAGQLLALLGPSGSGKSTLLNVLSGQILHGGRWSVRGSVDIDGRIASPSELSKSCAHVPQDDRLPLHLSVQECLLYSAAVRLGPRATPVQAIGRVAAVMKVGFKCYMLWSFLT